MTSTKIQVEIAEEGMHEAIMAILDKFKNDYADDEMKECQDKHLLLNKNQIMALIEISCFTVNTCLKGIVETLQNAGYCGKALLDVHRNFVLSIFGSYISTVSCQCDIPEKHVTYETIVSFLRGTGYSKDKIEQFFKDFEISCIGDEF